MTSAIDPAAAPDADIHVDLDVARGLLRRQAPQLAALPLAALAEGWDNVAYRVGDELLLRVPRRTVAVALIEHEQRWLPELAPRLPIPVPVPVVLGRPDDEFPYPWSVVPHVEGADGIVSPPDPAQAVDDLVSFLTALHVPAPADAPTNAVRGGPLAGRDGLTRRWIDGLADDVLRPAAVDPEALRDAWADAVAAPLHGGPPLWIHGDLHPGNVIVRSRRIAAVIDFGDLTAGDPATDCHVGHMLFDRSDRERFHDALGLDDAARRRARGWAITVGTAILANGRGRPGYEALGLRTVHAAVDDLTP